MIFRTQKVVEHPNFLWELSHIIHKYAILFSFSTRNNEEGLYQKADVVTVVRESVESKAKA